MKQLTEHIRHIRRQLIDGTILDMRYKVHNVLKDFDDITFHENQLEFLINNLALEPWKRVYHVKFQRKSSVSELKADSFWH